MADTEDQWNFDDDTGTAWDQAAFEDPEADAEAAAADAVVAQMTAPRPAPVKADDFKLSGSLDYMDDVVRRMDVANYYREILSTPLFEGGDDNAIQVENEIREFCIQRLQVLMGIKADTRPVTTAKAQFDENQAKVLKDLVNNSTTLLSLDPVKMAVIESLVTATLKHQGKAPPKPTGPARLAPKPAAAPPKPVAAPAPAPKPVVQQQPDKTFTPKPGTQQRKPAPAPIATPPARAAVARRGRPPGARSAPAPRAPVGPLGDTSAPIGPPMAGTVKRFVDGDNGVQEHETKVPVVQKPAGMVPFPDERSMQAASEMFASLQASSSAGRTLSEIDAKHNNF